jgi:hypothetical protein
MMRTPATMTHSKGLLLLAGGLKVADRPIPEIQTREVSAPKLTIRLAPHGEVSCQRLFQSGMGPRTLGIGLRNMLRTQASR